MTRWSFCRFFSHVRRCLSLFRICSNWYWVLTRISVTMCWAACHSKLARLLRALMCALKNVLMVRLATQFTINFLYLDAWLWRYILLTLLGELSVSFIPSGKLNNIFQSHVGYGARVLAFSLVKAPAPFLKNPPVHAYLLLLCVRKCVWFKRACDSNLSCAIGMRVCVSAAVCMCFFLSMTSCFWPVSLVTLS